MQTKKQPRYLSTIKKHAKALAVEKNISHSEALEESAQSYGFQNYHHAQKVYKQKEPSPNVIRVAFDQKRGWEHEKEDGYKLDMDFHEKLVESFRAKYPGVEDSRTTDEDLFDDYHALLDLVIYQITNPKVKTLVDCINFTTSVSEIPECIWINGDMFDLNGGMAPLHHWKGLEIRLVSDSLNLVSSRANLIEDEDD
jgi:hypothetical protein